MIRLRTLGPVALDGARGPKADAITRGPKRLALLVYLAIDPPRGFKRRDALAALFWPELDQQRARHALRNTLLELRKALGDGALCSRGSEEVGLSAEALWCDAVAFDERLAARQRKEALALYRGPFLDGFHVPGVAPEFEHWVDRQRERLTLSHVAALEGLAEDCEARKDFVAAVDHWRLLSAHHPWNGRVVLRLMLALEAVGDRAEALRRARIYGTLLRDELAAEPDPEVAALAARLREAPSRSHGRGGPPQVATVPSGASPIVGGLGQSANAPIPHAGRWIGISRTQRVRGALIALLLAVGAMGGLLWRRAFSQQAGGTITLAKAPALNSEAFELYVDGTQARYRAKASGDFRNAASYFSRALALDSGYAPAYAGLAHVHASIMDEVPARRLAEHALALDPTLAEAHVVLGMVRHFSNRDWAGSEAAFREAIRLDPGYAEAHHELSMLLMRRRRFDEAMRETQRTLYLAPMSARFEVGAGEVYLYSGRYDEALDAADRALAVDSSNAGSYLVRAYAYGEQRRYEEAAEAAMKCIALGWDVPGRAILGYVYAKSGRRVEALTIVDTLTARWQHGKGGVAVPGIATAIAQVYVGLGDRRRALDWLERAVTTDMYLVYLRIDPTFRSLRAEPRFRALLKKVGADE
jgi:DNA-binding SARP family transcriptional activator